MEDLKRMAYLERVIKETIRLYPSVPGITRKLRQHLNISKSYDSEFYLFICCGGRSHNIQQFYFLKKKKKIYEYIYFKNSYFPISKLYRGFIKKIKI